MSEQPVSRDDFEAWIRAAAEMHTVVLGLTIGFRVRDGLMTEQEAAAALRKQADSAEHALARTCCAELADWYEGVGPPPPALTLIQGGRAHGRIS